jgi:2-aminoadipate transaminase
LAQKYSQDHRILVLEDAAYRELCYDGPPQPAVKSFDPSNEWVIFTTTFSKPCAPGLKTGYTLMPAELSEMVARIKASHDFGSAHLTQVILDTMLRDGSYDQHAARLRANYRLKRDTMLEALQEAFADCPEVRWNRPVGGLYVYLSFPSEIPTGPGSELLEASFREGVMYIPGEFGHTPDANQPAHYRSEARLSFGVADLTAIREGVQRLRRAYTSCKPALVMA